MKYLWMILICTQVQAGIKVVNGEIQPFTNTKYPIKEFVKDYAEMMNLNVTYTSSLLRDKDTLHIQLNTKTTTEEFKKLFYESISSQGYTPIEDNNILFLVNTRDVRYLPSKVYTDRSFPADASYSTIVYQLKYPLSSEIARNMRPFMSRYGRVIDLSDARTIIIHDRGDNTARLLDTIANLDSEAAYKSILEYKPKTDEDEGNPLKEKVLDLELDRKLLEKKIIELKEGHQ
jgi:general secretion pathway protein D